MNISKLVSVATIAMLASAANAGVSSVKQVGDGVTEEGEKYTIYSAKCSSTREALFTQYGRKFCVGELGLETCSKNKIKIAKKSCKASK